MDYSKYHPDWKDVIRPLALKRGQYKCSVCGIRHKSRVYLANKTNYVEKIQALNTYTKKGYSVDSFIKAVSPFNANTLLKDLKRFSHTNFYKDMKSYIDIFKLGYDEL